MGDEPPDCVALCEKGKAERCRGAELLMCEENCLGEDYRVERTNCRPEYNAMLECTERIADICDVLGQCRSEYDTLCDCYHDYCNAHPDEMTCDGICR